MRFRPHEERRGDKRERRKPRIEGRPRKSPSRTIKGKTHYLVPADPVTGGRSTAGVSKPLTPSRSSSACHSVWGNAGMGLAGRETKRGNKAREGPRRQSCRTFACGRAEPGTWTCPAWKCRPAGLPQRCGIWRSSWCSRKPRPSASPEQGLRSWCCTCSSPPPSHVRSRMMASRFSILIFVVFSSSPPPSGVGRKAFLDS